MNNRSSGPEPQSRKLGETSSDPERLRSVDRYPLTQPGFGHGGRGAFANLPDVTQYVVVLCRQEVSQHETGNAAAF